MKKRINHRGSALVFVYNSKSGLFSALTDTAHKIFSPATYQCHLCALTHSQVGMRKGWKDFLETLEVPFEFLHADELKQRYGDMRVQLPAIFTREDGKLELQVDAAEVNRCRTIDDLKQLVEKRVLDKIYNVR